MLEIEFSKWIELLDEISLLLYERRITIYFLEGK